MAIECFLFTNIDRTFFPFLFLSLILFSLCFLDLFISFTLCFLFSCLWLFLSILSISHSILLCISLSVGLSLLLSICRLFRSLSLSNHCLWMHSRSLILSLASLSQSVSLFYLSQSFLLSLCHCLHLRFMFLSISISLSFSALTVCFSHSMSLNLFVPLVCLWFFCPSLSFK